MKTWVIGTTTISLALFIAGCFAGSSIVKGYVVMRTTSEAHINLGGDDGIQVGDTLTVWRQESSGATTNRTVRVGIVRVTKLLDDHNAAVEILAGGVRERDSVEKKIQ